MSPDNARGQLRAGQLLADRYVVQQLIGLGGMAEVYRARDERLARPVALKVLRSRYSHDPVVRARFEEEARAAAHVSHPHVVAVYDAGEDDSKAFIVMELVEGETLHRLISRGRVEPGHARSIGLEVLDALRAAHESGVLHRDIKPANVLLTREHGVKVADFGIAKAVHPSPGAENHTTTDVVLGTPSYLAPERAQGEPATVRSDLWSVGVLLYEAVAGQRPFQGENPVAITLAAEQHRFAPLLERVPDLDPAFAAAIERALEPDPALRFASAGEMAAALGAAADTAVLGSPGIPGDGREPTSPLAAAAVPAAALGGAGLLGAAGETAHLSTSVPTGAAGETRVLGASEGRDERPDGRRSRRGVAVLAGAVVALVLGGVAVAMAVSPTSAPGRAPDPPATQPKAKLSGTPSSTGPSSPPSTTSPSLTTSGGTGSSTTTTGTAPTTTTTAPIQSSTTSSTAATTTTTSSTTTTTTTTPTSSTTTPTTTAPGPTSTTASTARAGGSTTTSTASASHG